jgi:hypothetical protein
MGYVISEEDHLLLTGVRDQLRLLMTLSAPRGPCDLDLPLDLQPSALAQSYQSLHESVELVARNARWLAH